MRMGVSGRKVRLDLVKHRQPRVKVGDVFGPGYPMVVLHVDGRYAEVANAVTLRRSRIKTATLQERNHRLSARDTRRVMRRMLERCRDMRPAWFEPAPERAKR